MTTQPGTGRADWRPDAACRGADPELFFPIGTGGPALVQIDEAKQICRTCPVRAPCLAWALDHEVADGVWGGTTADERRTIRGRHQAVSRDGRVTVTVTQSTTGRSTENMEYVRRLLRQRQPAFSAALDLAAELVASELRSSQLPPGGGARESHGR